MTQKDKNGVRQWLEAFIARKAGIPPSQFMIVADSPIYELLDSLDLVEMLGAFEQQFGVTLDASTLKWEQQPSANQLVNDLTVYLQR